MIAWIRKGLHMLINVNSGGHWVAVDEAKSLATGQIYIMDSLSGAQNTDLTLASRYASFNAIHAYTGGSTPSGGTVTPDPGLSVKETITCKRTIKLPERVVNLYSNPTDTTRLTYFDYGPTVYSSRYAVMSDGSIMYEVGATNHQGQDIKVWLKYESDMTVTKQHTYGSTQYEFAHPHRGYRVCECGDKTYTGETTTRDDCSECGGEVKYAVEGGYLTFDKKTGTVTNCDPSVTKANIPHTIKGVTVTSIGGSAFRYCTSLTSVTIPDSVTSIGGWAFTDCASLTSVTIPDGVTSIGEYTFSWCTSLTSATIPDSVTSIGGRAFDGCESLTSVTIPDSVTSIGEDTFSGCTSLTSVTIPDSVTSIGDWAFSGCKSLTSVTIPDSVTSIGGYAFTGCKSLTSVTIPDSVTSTGEYTFSDCVSLTSVTIPDSVTCIDNGAFYGCRSLTSVTIPDSVTSIGRSAFSRCTSLTSVTIPDSVTSIGSGAFSNCAALTGIWVTEGNSHYSSDASGVLFSKDKTTLVQCPGTLAACTIPDSVTSIVGYAFYYCTSLTSVTIPDSVMSIGQHAFQGCKSLTSVTIPDSVTSISSCTFASCTSLTSVTIPDSVTSIGYSAFYYCTSLTDVYYAGSEAQWKAISISSNGNDDLLTANIHYNYVSHTHSYKDVVTAPTCTEKGYTTHTCACGDSYVDTYTDALGHAWDEGKVTKPATEAEAGIKTYTCTRCGETKTETIPKLTHEHSYKDVVTAPTCTEKGYTTHTCACGDSYVDTYTDPLGHDLKDDAAVAATCTTAGTTAGKHCTRCDYKEGMETIAALGHAWDEGEMTKEATETTQGSMTYTCTRCPATKRDILPASGLVATAVYNDVKNDTSWFYPGVQYCLSYGLMSGMGNGSFAPGEYTTRAQVAQILYNLHGNPEVSGGTPFTDVPEGAWYQKAVTWAHSVGIVNGVTATTFSPNANITRQDFVLMLMRYLNNVRMVDRTWKPDDLSRFADAGSVGFWALDAMKDAVAINAISGAPVDGRLYIQPARNATRAEAAKILMVFHKTMTK